MKQLLALTAAFCVLSLLGCKLPAAPPVQNGMVTMTNYYPGNFAGWSGPWRVNGTGVLQAADTPENGDGIPIYDTFSALITTDGAGSSIAIAANAHERVTGGLAFGLSGCTACKQANANGGESWHLGN